MRYAKQELAKGWKQKKLQDSRIVVTGSNNLASFILSDLIAMGFGSVTRIGESSFKFLDFRGLNPDVSLEEIPGSVLNEELAKSYIGKPDFLINASSGREKRVCLEYTAKNHLPSIFASCSKESYKIRVLSKDGDSGSAASSCEDEKNDGTTNAIIAAGIVTDEVRKRIMPLPGDKTLTKLSAASLEGKIEQKVLLVGAGAIGTFAGIGLAMAGAEVDVLDFDRVEESNLNRQILFYDALGRFKAEAMAEKLSPLSKFRGIIGKVDEKYKLQRDYGLILGCVDNANARYYLDWLSHKANVPLLNAGTSFTQGSVMPYITGKTACLDCQSFGRIREARKEVNRGSCYEPVTIISNQIIGGLLVSKISRMYEDTDTIKYDSNSGIRKIPTLKECLSGCEKNGKSG